MRNGDREISVGTLFHSLTLYLSIFPSAAYLSFFVGCRHRNWSSPTISYVIGAVRGASFQGKAYALRLP